MFWFFYGPGDVGHELTSMSIREGRELGWKGFVFFLSCVLFILCMYICLWTRAPWQASGGQRTVCRSRVSPSTLWIPGLKPGSSSLEAEACFHWAISPALSIYFNSSGLLVWSRLLILYKSVLFDISWAHVWFDVSVNVHSWTGHFCRDSFCVWT